MSHFNNKSKFKVLDIACGFDHSFVLVEETSDNKQPLGKRLYQIGNDKS